MMTVTELLARLVGAAGEATPGPWEHSDIDPLEVRDVSRGNLLLRAMSNEPEQNQMVADAAFAAESDPEVVAALAVLARAVQDDPTYPLDGLQAVDALAGMLREIADLAEKGGDIREFVQEDPEAWGEMMAGAHSFLGATREALSTLRAVARQR